MTVTDAWLVQLQDMGKVEAGKLDLEHRAFRLEEIIADARIFSVAASKKQLDFIVDVDSRLFGGPVLGDMPRLRQVLSNLLSNAIKVRARRLGTRKGTLLTLSLAHAATVHYNREHHDSSASGERVAQRHSRALRGAGHGSRHQGRRYPAALQALLVSFTLHLLN